MCVCYSSPDDIFPPLLSRESGREVWRRKERERNNVRETSLSPTGTTTRVRIAPAAKVQAHNWELNPQPLSAGANALSSEQHQPGIMFFNSKILERSDMSINTWTLIHQP